MSRNAERHAKRPDERRRYKLMKNYGLTLEGFAERLRLQGGCCAICARDLTNLTTKDVHVDHCHQSGVVRGLLCSRCNVAIGMTQENPDILLKAAEYVRLWAMWK